MKSIQFSSVMPPTFLLNDHRRRGGRELLMVKCRVGDGELRIMIGLEPAGPNEEMIRHASSSVGKPGELEAFRFSTEDENKMVTDFLGGRFPGIEWEREAGHGYATHFWEVS